MKIDNEIEVERGGKPQRDWKIAIDGAKAIRREKIGSTANYYDMWRDVWNELSALEREHQVTVNMVFANTATIIPLVYFQDPSISITPIGPHPKHLEAGALPDYELMERIVNYKMVQMRYYRTERMVVLDTSLSGNGISKLGYSRIFEKDAIVGETLVTEDDIWIQRVSPFQFLCDPLAKDEESARWLGEELYIPYIEFMDTFSDSKIAQKVKPTHKIKATEHEGVIYEKIMDDDASFDNEMTVVLVYEIWDKVERKVILLADGLELEPIEEEDWPFENMQDFPYEWLRFHEDPESPWGISPVRHYESQQEELNFHRSKLAAIHAKNARKYGILRGALEPEEMEKLERGDDGAVVQFELHPDKAYRKIEETGYHGEAAQVQEIIRSDINILSGVDDSTRGQVTKGRTTATEIEKLAGGTQIRSDDKRTQVEKHIKYTWTKGIKILVEKMTGTQYAQYYNEEIERPEVIEFSASDITGEYAVDVQVGSTQQPNRQVRGAQLMQLAGLLAGNPYVDQKQLARTLLKEFQLNPSGMLLNEPQFIAQPNAATGQQTAPDASGGQEASGEEPTTAGLKRVIGGSTGLE